MPDITMCTGIGCLRAWECYRYTATPKPDSWWQSYMDPPMNPDGSCDYYWDNELNKLATLIAPVVPIPTEYLIGQPRGQPPIRRK